MKIELVQGSKKQHTISKEFTFEGQSLFSTSNISMKLLPSAVNTGIVFNVNGSKIPALSDNLKFTELHTTSLAKDGVEVMMIEHLMAAIYGLGIDNIEIQLEGKVIPAKDGSAASFTKALKEAGIVEQEELRTVIKINEGLNFEQPEFEGRKATLKPSEDLTIELTAPFPAPIGTHTVKYNESDDFEKKCIMGKDFLTIPT